MKNSSEKGTRSIITSYSQFMGQRRCVMGKFYADEEIKREKHEKSK